MKNSQIPKLAALLFNFTFLILNCSAQLTPIQYNASDFTGTTNNLPVTLTSLMRIQIGYRTMLVGLPIVFTPANGTYTTNVYPGLYNLTIQGIPEGVTCLVPSSTNPQNLANCVISNMGLFSAANLNAVITNPVALLPGTNIQMTTNGFNVTVNGVVTNLSGATISNATIINSTNDAIHSDGGLISSDGSGDLRAVSISGDFTGTFNGDGTGVTNIQATNITGGFSNLTVLGAVNSDGGTFASDGSGNVIANSLSTVTTLQAARGLFGVDGVGNTTAASFTGIGSGLTSLTAANLSGQVPSGSLTNYPTLNAASDVFSGTITASNGFGSKATNAYSVTATGYTNLSAKTVRIFGMASATSAYFTNLTSHLNFKIGTNVPYLTLNTNEGFVGTSVIASNIIDF
jgi:hypothetical protein